jgi:nucleotide-binding universal stress UspA family protein
MIGSILVPVDGSNHVRRALEFAADLAQKYGTRLIVVHVTTRPGSGHVPEELR